MREAWGPLRGETGAGAGDQFHCSSADFHELSLAVTHALGTKLRLEVKERQRSGGRGSFLSGSVSSSISTSHEATTPGNKNLEKMVQQYHCIAGTNESDGVQ